MRPTITVNLGGLLFTFNDNAYRLMSEYLQSLTDAFRAQGLDADELTWDIESRCAEILSDLYDRSTYIVTEGDITMLIDRMGRPEEIIDVEVTENPGQTRINASAPEVPPTNIPTSPQPLRKRLYRIKQGAELGGVCGGIAAYCNWDPSYVRLATVVLAFLSVSTVCIAYIVLWIVIPQAKTPLQDMELRGESPTLNNIGKTVKQAFGYGEERSETPKYTPYEKLNDEVREPNRKAASGVAKFFSFIAKILLGIFGFACALIVLILLVTAIGGTIWGVWQLFYHHDLPPYFFDKVAIIACSCVIIGLPLTVVVWLIIRALFGLKLQSKISPAWRLSLFIIWTVTMLLSIKLVRLLPIENF